MRVFLPLVCALVFSVAMANAAAPLSSQVNSIAWSDIIGGPLQAVVSAQAVAATTTAEFIRVLGLSRNATNPDDPTLHVTMVDFLYNQVTEQDGEISVNERKISVPFITMLPIPYMEVANFTYIFNMELTDFRSQTASDSYYRQSSSSDNYYRYSYAMGSFSSQQRHGNTASAGSTFSSSVTSERYKVRMRVEAGASETPGGTTLLLDLLESLVQASAPPEALEAN